MSHFSKITTQISDKDCLLKALADLGFKESMVEDHSTAQNLYGYRGDVRPEKAEVIIRRKYVGSASNDLGFAWQPDSKTYQAIISEFDQHTYNEAWLRKLSQRYSYHNVVKQAALTGFTVMEETTADGQIYLTLQPLAAANSIGGF